MAQSKRRFALASLVMIETGGEDCQGRDEDRRRDFKFKNSNLKFAVHPSALAMLLIVDKAREAQLTSMLYERCTQNTEIAHHSSAVFHYLI